MFYQLYNPHKVGDYKVKTLYMCANLKWHCYNAQMMIHPVMLIALGGACGAMLRYASINAITPHISTSHHAYATLLVNVVGSFFMGILWAILMEQGATHPARLFLMVGVLGSFTTFSAFSLDVMQYMQQGTIAHALAYAISSVIISVIAIMGGATLGKLLL
jgi:fluoride exporter